MKKLLSTLLIFLLIFSFAGCNTNPEEPKTSGSKSSQSTSQSTTTVTKKPEKVLPEKPEDPRAEPMATLEYYLAANEDEEAEALKKSAEAVKPILMFTMKMELSPFIIYNFVKEDLSIGVLALDISDDNITRAPELPDGNLFYRFEYIDYEIIKENINECYELHDGKFEIYGMFDSAGYGGGVGGHNSVIYELFGKLDKDGPLLMGSGESLYNYFTIEDDVYSIEEHKLALKEYNTNKNAVIANAPIFPPYETSNGWHGLEDGSLGPTRFEYLVACPVSNETNEHEPYMLHLLYRRNILIGECLMQKKEDSASNTTLYFNLFETYSDINETTLRYEEFTDSLYLKTIEDFKTANPDTEIKGVSFDGENFHVIPME